MKQVLTKKAGREEVYVIATRYRNEPLDVSFYTKNDGIQVPAELVEKKRTKKGVKLFAVTA